MLLLQNVNAVTFYRYKMYHIFGHGHYDIIVLKQNNLLIINISFSFITVKQSKIMLCVKLTFK